ncbi:MAG: 2-hydroxyhepta-2,4-diene,7-dioate isomerase [Gemmatimonadetes bacterium]|nr:2-hydroxyhepta-2,4-diene,7-dioate isomerase [Gemmatimonadota bacterium]
MKLYRTSAGAVAEERGFFYPLRESWDDVINQAHLAPYLRDVISRGGGMRELIGELRAPIESQEVWAAGVTYFRSRTARIEESHDAGSGTFYDRVYSAERPELFFKAAGWRVRASGGTIRIRRDATWNVPEPELALYINSVGKIIGYTIGNDVSSRDIEGENPLYLPQAKVYDGSCALGPCVLVTDDALPAETPIAISIVRAGAEVFQGETSISQMRRTPVELVEYLYREMSFPRGAVLLTGTGVVPPDGFTLQSGDRVDIRIEPIGVLSNVLE